MGIFDRFRKKKDQSYRTDEKDEQIKTDVPAGEDLDEPVSADHEERVQDSRDDADSLSLSMSKDSVQEETTPPEEAGTPKSSSPGESAFREASISNESITKGTALLETYEVISDAIKGGMGSVWKVHHKSWNTVLAMKRPQPKFFAEGSERRKENFIHECEAWINLGLHPNIVSCYYVREIDGVPTIFSEWMENGSLKNRIEDGSLYELSDGQEASPEEKEQTIQARLLDIAIQFARGLHYAHESKDRLIHQDVKPDNLLLTKTWEAKVADFGLARARTQLLEGEDAPAVHNGLKAASAGGAEPQGGLSAGATRIASTGGYTPAYCSMEQYLGEPLTRRTDIYSWAVSVLEMYLADRPWKNGAEAGRNCGSYFDKCRVKIQGALRTLLTNCLAECPEDRPHDFGLIGDELEKIYQELCGHSYFREKPKTAADISASLNNRALSYIDLGKDEEAEALLKQAVEKDASCFLYHFNYALHRWNRRIISDAEFLTYLRGNADESELYKTVSDTLNRMRGGFDIGKEEYLYKKGERPDDLEPLLPLSDISADGMYRVQGYMEKERFEPEKYGYRLENLGSGESTDFPNHYKDYGESTSRSGGYMHPHFYKSDDVKFALAGSELIIMQADVLWFFEAKSGRLLLSIPPVVDEDGDTMPYEVLGYTAGGMIEYMNWEQRWGRWTVKAIRLHPEAELHYELAGIATVDARLKAERDMIRYYEEASRCWEQGDIAGTYHALNQSLEDQVLTMHEPSLRLWTKLGGHYKRGALVTVVPTQDEATPAPERYACLPGQVFSMTDEFRNRTDNGQTELVLRYDEEDEYDTCNDMFEYTFTYHLTACDRLSGKEYFEVNCLEVACEADWKAFSKDRYLGLTGDCLLWYAQEYAKEEIIDLSEMSREKGKFRYGASRVSFSLPNGYHLKNTEKGVDIGGFVFDDVFVDFRPLWASDIIACRDHNYRLVYSYVPDADASSDQIENSQDQKS